MREGRHWRKRGPRQAAVHPCMSLKSCHSLGMQAQRAEAVQSTCFGEAGAGAGAEPWARSWWSHPHRIFVPLALVFGLALLLVTPPFQVPDETEHFLRSYHVSEGGVLARVQDRRVGEDLPRSLLAVMVEAVPRGIYGNAERHQERWRLRRAMAIPLVENDRLFQDFSVATLTSPVAYAPQAISIALGRQAGLHPLVLMYVGRLGNLLVWTALVGLALRLTPVGAWLFLMLALTPMSLFMAASLSYDALTNALSFLTVAMALRLALGARPVVGWRDAARFGGVVLALTATKFVYGCLAALFLLVPVRRVGSLWKRVAMLAMIALAVGVFALWWGHAASTRWLVGEDYHEDYRASQGVMRNVDPWAQMERVARDVAGFVMERALPTVNRINAAGYVGVLGWLDTRFPAWYYVGHWALLLVAASVGGDARVPLRLSMRVVLGAVGGLGALGFLLVLYATYSPLGSSYIVGVQGRYFIPFGPPLFLLLSSARLAATRRTQGLLALGTVVPSLTGAIVLLVSRYHL